MRLLSFSDLEPLVENPTDPSGEERVVPGQFIVKDTQFYSPSAQVQNYNMDDTVSNYEYKFRKINSYNARNEEESKIRLIFTIGSRKPENFRYLQLTFAGGFEFLKKFLFSSGTTNYNYKIH